MYVAHIEWQILSLAISGFRQSDSVQLVFARHDGSLQESSFDAFPTADRPGRRQ
jgi:hypothetical protein